jgi:hypothetical protein
MKTIVITRKYWGTHYLLRTSDSKMCCLGFTCAAYKLPKKHMLGVRKPVSLRVPTGIKLPQWLFDTWAGTDVGNAMNINDNDSLTMAQKEEQLKPIFLKHNIKLVFRGKP